METKSKRTSGVCRIFSLSLNEAISNKESAACITERSSATTSPENDKANVKSDHPPDRRSVNDSYTRCGPACRQNTARTSENKKRAGCSDALKDSHKQSQYLNTSASSNTKRRIESSSRKTEPHSENSSSGKTPVSSSSRTTSRDGVSSAHVHSEASCPLQATDTCGKNGRDSGFATLQSEDATRSYCSELNSLQTDTSPHAGKSTPQTRKFSDRAPSRTVHSSSSHVPKDSGGQLSSSARSQRATAHSTSEGGSSAGQLRSKSISDRRDSKSKMSRNHFTSDSLTSSRKSQEACGKQTENDPGKTGKSSFEGQCSKTKSEKTVDRYSGSRGAVYGKQQSEQLPGKGVNRSKSSGHQSAHYETKRLSYSAVSTDCLSGKYSSPPQSASTSRANTGTGKEVVRGASKAKGKEYRGGLDEVTRGGSSKQNSVSSKSKGDTNAGRMSHSTTFPRGQQRRQGHGNYSVGVNSRRSVPTQPTTASNSESPALVSSPAPNDESDWDSKTPNGDKCLGVTANPQEDISAVPDKIQIYSQTENPEKALSLEYGTEKQKVGTFSNSVSEHGIEQQKVGACSNSDVSEMEVWFDVKEETSKQSSRTDMAPVMGSSADNVSTNVSRTECDNMSESAKPISIAKMRQASIATRMRGNRRLKSCTNRMKLTEDNLMQNSEQKEEMHPKDTAKSGSDHRFDRSVDDGKIRETRPSEILEKCSTEIIKGQKNENTAFLCVGLGEELTVDHNRSSKSRKDAYVHENLSRVNECSDISSYDTKVESSLTDQNRTESERGTKHCHERTKDEVSKEPLPLMALQPTPTAHVLNSVSAFGRSKEDGWSSDSCLPPNQHPISLQKSSSGFGKPKVRSGSTVSSSSYTPPSSTNSLSQNLSCSSTSYASLLSDDFRDSMTHDTGFSKKKDGCRKDESNTEYFSDSPSLHQSSSHNSMENSWDEVESQALGSNNKHSRLTSCSGYRIVRQPSKAAVSSAVQHSDKPESDSQCQQDKMRTWERNLGSCSSDDLSVCGDADRDQLSLSTSEFGPHTFEHTDRISRESSTDTVTETPDAKLQNDDADDSPASVENVADKTVSDESLFVHSSRDSDSQVCNPFYPSESGQFSDKYVNSDNYLNRSLENGQVMPEHLQPPAVDCRQCHKAHRSRKHRPVTSFPQTKCRHLDSDIDQEQISGNKHGQTLESGDAGRGKKVSGSKFSNQGLDSSSYRETNHEALGIAISREKLSARKNKHRQQNEQSCNEESFPRLKEVQEFGRMVQSVSGSKCSESVSKVSEHVCADSVYLKGSDLADRRCMTWVKEMEQWPAKTGEGDSESENNPYPPSVHHSRGKLPHAFQKYCVFGGEGRSDSDTRHPLRTSPVMSEDDIEIATLTERKPQNHAAHQSCRPSRRSSGLAQNQRDQGLQQRTDRKLQDAGDSHVTANQADQECDVSNTSLPRNHKGADDRRKVVDGDSAHSRHRHHSEPCKKHKCSGSNPCREHDHSSHDLSNTKVQTSSSSDCEVDVLSQSDFDDLSAYLQRKEGSEGDKHPASSGQSFQTSASNEHWPGVYQNGPVPYYPSCIPKSHTQSCCSSYYPETDMWGPPHQAYYEQWYNAWMAYSMGCYGYGFQGRDQGMDFSEAYQRRNCGCSSPPTCLQQHSGPSSRPSSQPPSRPPSSLDNPTYRDTRNPYVVSPIQSEKSDSQQYFHGDRNSDSSGGQYFHGDRSGDNNSGGQYFNGDRSSDNSGQYFHGDRSGESSGARDPRTVVLSCPVQEVFSTQCVPDHIRKEPLDAGGRSNVNFEMPMQMKKEEKDSKICMQGDQSSAGQSRSENRNVQNDPASSDSSWKPYLADEHSHTNLLGEHSVNANGNHFFRCHSKMPVLPPYGPGSRLPHCGGDYASWHGFSPRAFLPPRMMMGPMVPTFRFCTPPQPYQGFRPPETIASLSCGVKEERKETPPRETYPSEQQQYKECNNLRPFHGLSLFHRGLSAEWSLRPQHPLLPTPTHPVPPSPHPPPPPPKSGHQGPREMDSQTSCSIETTSSEACRLDSSFETRGDYDGSSSEVDEANRGDSASTKRKRTDPNDVGFDMFVAAQRQRYLQMYKDSGSEDLDSSSAPSSKQSNTVKLSDDQDDNNSSGSGAIPKRQGSSARGVLRSLHRRSIPFNNRDRSSRSCPSTVESIPSASPDQGTQSEKNTGLWGSGFLTPPAGLSYGQAVSSPGAWWNQSKQSDTLLYEENFPTLSAAAALPQSAALGSVNETSTQTGTSEEKDGYRDTKDDYLGKGFFRQKFMEQSGGFRGGKAAMSRYASRLLGDNRLSSGSRGGKETREAFYKAYQTTFVDTHCHLDFLFNREPYTGTYASYREKNKGTFPSNYEGCVAVFCKPKSFANESKWKPIVEEDGVWMAMGCHPKNATEYSEWTEEGLLKALKHKKTVALGEIGLDYSKHHGQSSEVQKQVFIRQIKIALEMNLPLVIHCREAEDDCLQILEQYVPSDYKIHCHCFTTNYESATRWTSRFQNLFIGLTPLVTFRSAVEVHQVARHLPLNKLLLETDAPYFLPFAFEGEGKSLSHPGMALTVAIRVAELRGISVEEVLVHVRRNTKEMYGV